MSRFAIKYPFLIIVICLAIAIVGTVALVRMPVDLFLPSTSLSLSSPRFIPACLRSRSKPTSRIPSNDGSHWPVAWIISNRAPFLA